ncbi:MAG: ABC transporter permease, partial [Ferrovibrionaceae bacterium]
MTDASLITSSRRLLSPVAALRIGIVAAVLGTWEIVAASGLLFRDVVPSLPAIGKALGQLLIDPVYYANLGVTVGELLGALAVGGGLGLAVGMVLGANAYLGKAFEEFLYYLGPTPKIIFFPVMLLWFGVDTGSKVAMGALSCFFPIAVSALSGMRQVDGVLIRVGRS